MATTDPLTGATIYQQTDQALGGQQIGDVVTDLAPFTLPRFSTTAARDTAYANWVAAGHAMANGLECWVTSLGHQVYTAANGWVTVFDGTEFLSAAAATSRVAITNTALTGVDTALTGVITVPAIASIAKVVFVATGRTGGAASSRTIAWDWDSKPASATNVASDDPNNKITVAAGQLATISSTLAMNVPAGVAATARLMYRADNNGTNFGAVVWHRSAIV